VYNLTKVWISEFQAVQRTLITIPRIPITIFWFQIEPRDRPSYVTWPRIDRSRGQRQAKYLYHFGIFFVIFRNILSEYHIQIKTIKICKLRQGQTMIIIEPLFRTEFLKKWFFYYFLEIFLEFSLQKNQ